MRGAENDRAMEQKLEMTGVGEKHIKRLILHFNSARRSPSSTFSQ